MMSPLLLLSCFKLVKDIFNYLSRYVLRQALTMRAYIQLRKRGVRHAVINYEQSLSTLSDHDFLSRQRKEYLSGENSSEKVEGGKFHFLARQTIESRLRHSQIYLSQWESSSNLARFASQTKFVVCIISNGNRTECSPIRFVIIRLITKSDDRAVEVRFVYYKYDNKIFSAQLRTFSRRFGQSPSALQRTKGLLFNT